MTDTTSTTRLVLLVLMSLVVLLWASPLFSSLFAAELPDLDVTDLWDYPRRLRSIAAEGSTLFFICDPDVKECREGAVFFDSRVTSIREAGFRPVLLFSGKPADVRSAVLKMGLDSPVYVDEHGRAIESMMEQEVLPALLLAEGSGEVLDVVYGGGESLAGNIEQILALHAAEPPPPIPAEPQKKSHRTYKVLAALAVITAVGIIIFAD